VHGALSLTDSGPTRKKRGAEAPLNTPSLEPPGISKTISSGGRFFRLRRATPYQNCVRDRERAASVKNEIRPNLMAAW
jgi:hypothetical protein